VTKLLLNRLPSVIFM